jgi:hypothetical protein
VLEALVHGELGARQAQKQVYAIPSKAVTDLPEPLWRLLDSMAAEEQRGHRSVVFEGRIQQLTMAADQLRTQVARGERPPERRAFRRWRAWRSWLVGGAAVVWWVALALMDEGRYIGLSDDEGSLLAMAGFAAAALWWLVMAARERFGTRRWLTPPGRRLAAFVREFPIRSPCDLRALRVSVARRHALARRDRAARRHGCRGR